MLETQNHEWITLKNAPQKGTLVEMNHSRRVVRKTQICTDSNEAPAFKALLEYLMKNPDARLVTVRAVQLTDEGYSYEMDRIGKGPTQAENLLVELYGEQQEGSLKDQMVLDRLSCRLPELTQFLESSLGFYFDYHGFNLRRTAQGYKWIDLEGLQWQYTPDGRVFLGSELIANYRSPN